MEPHRFQSQNIAPLLGNLNSQRSPDEAKAILELFYDLPKAHVAPFGSGRVNQTFSVTIDGDIAYVLQRLNPRFGSDASLGLNLTLVHQALEGQVGCPKLVLTQSGQPLALDPQNSDVWRLSTFVNGRPPLPRSINEAREAAAALGRTHYYLNNPKPILVTALADDGDVTNQRLNTREDFQCIAARYRGHPNLEAVLPELTRGMKNADWLPTRPSFCRIFLARDLVIHRDSKRENFLAPPVGPMAIIDWDTVGFGDPMLDLGEMCRSFAVSPTKPHFDEQLAKALVDGYRQTAPDLVLKNLNLLPAVIRGLALNLARRYLTDSLAEVYFKWDQQAYPSLHAQNLSRGRLYLDLAEELLDREIELMNI
ncbi:MAG: phosphotransferase [Deltaproteobacteria bacterium]|jgi:Ser/Thr protein kinase RdoA (MazF antagonist)|nr:phosphotransferase [Deltaproteobacteria bacterium]